MDVADITGDGLNDVIISHDCGATMVDCDPLGTISWLQNPGFEETKAGVEWKAYPIGKVLSTHRLRVGHFTCSDKVQVLSLPTVARHFDLSYSSPTTVTLFTQPDDVFNAKEWPSQVISNDHFRIVHDAFVHKGANVTFGLDSVLLASSEGITALWWDSKVKKWQFNRIGEGELGAKVQTGFEGSAGVASGKIGDQHYVVAVEPFHGNTLALYTQNNAHDTSSLPGWSRTILEVYGEVDVHGEGPAHYITTSDLDEDGEDEFLVALSGPEPHQGVFYYKILDLQNAIVEKWRVSQESAASIAIGDFDGDGHLDFATISYNLPKNYEDARPSVNVYYNTFVGQPRVNHSDKNLKVYKEGDLLKAIVPKPSEIMKFVSLPFVEIGGIAVSLEVIPPKSSRLISGDVSLKVVSGKIFWNQNGVRKERSWCASPKTVSPISFESDDGRVITGDTEGAIIFAFTLPRDRIPHFSDKEHLTLKNVFASSSAQDLLHHSFSWRPVGEFIDKFQGLEFYNFKGIEIFQTSDGKKVSLLNTQFWAAGANVDCGLHNHDDITFCEVHACLVNGTGEGGMTYGETLEPEAEQRGLPVPSFHEHGPLWVIEKDGAPQKAQNGTVVYPWHRWLAGSSKTQSYDVWMAYEFNPDFASVNL
eukprot:TRINITY_DN6757_c0_g1_i1.p1 TRINITY_DN6757_c0_g1~~TRINITY_DN6757_c0_g1_i1.p1  ORF type:complete len:741 (+),score=120.84 TRINITY_DN6757_c0_g1_i1:286-2223(+)